MDVYERVVQVMMIDQFGFTISNETWSDVTTVARRVLTLHHVAFLESLNDEDFEEVCVGEEKRMGEIASQSPGLHEALDEIFMTITN